MNENNNQETLASKTLADVMNLPQNYRELMNWIIDQKQVTITDVTNYTQLIELETQQQLQYLLAQGFIKEFAQNNLSYFKPCLGTKHKSQLPQKLWDKLDD